MVQIPYQAFCLLHPDTEIGTVQGQFFHVPKSQPDDQVSQRADDTHVINHESAHQHQHHHKLHTDAPKFWGHFSTKKFRSLPLSDRQIFVLQYKFEMPILWLVKVQERADKSFFDDL